MTSAWDPAAVGRTRETLNTGFNMRRSKREFLLTDKCSRGNVVSVPIIAGKSEKFIQFFTSLYNITFCDLADLIANFSRYSLANKICRNDNVINTD